MATAALARTMKKVATVAAVGLPKAIKTEVATAETKVEAATAVAAASKPMAADTVTATAAADS